MSQIAERFSLLEGGQGTDFELDEIDVTRGEVSLSLLVNRRTKTMRVIDFRSGSQPGKLGVIQKVAAEQGVVRAYTIVEREEAATWAKMGFAKEGSIPGFYKRSDGHILGLQFNQEAPFESGTRIRISRDADTPAEERAERAYQAGRRLVRANAPESLPRVKVAEPKASDLSKALSNAQVSGRALTGVEPFGRGVERTTRLCTARGGFSLLVFVEIQMCFDNAFLEALVAPRGDKETWLTSGGLDQICAELKEREICSVFALSPVESVELSAAYIKAGFRKTGLLSAHLQVAAGRADGFLWSRRLLDVC